MSRPKNTFCTICNKKPQQIGTHCRICRRDYAKTRYHNNKDEERTYRQKYKNKLTIFINSYKNKPCMDCLGQFHPVQMEFDHRDPTTKVASIARLRASHAPKKKILDEMDKCDLVCANCHALRTYNQSRPN